MLDSASMKINGQDGVKTLIFDFGGVFMDLDIPRCIENFKKIGFDNVGEYLTSHLQSGFFGALDRGEITPAQFRDEVRNAAARPQLSDSQIDEAWTSMLAGIPKYKLDFARDIKPRFNRVVLLSNINLIDWNFAVENFLRAQGFQPADLFDKCYLSFEMNIAKPDPRIFQTLLASENLNPNDAFLIDDAKVNCDAASKLGIKTYQPQPLSDWRHIFS